MRKYIPANIEAKWQAQWEKAGLYKFNPDNPNTPYYSLVELPYTSGDLHLGHWFAFSGPDAYARFKRMQGYNSFFPIGFDAFGLPAENAAIKRGIHPKDWTFSNIETMTRQFKTMGTMLAWDHEAITCEPKYYRWNQWIFLKMWLNGLAYRGKTLSNWCPLDQTVLADENVVDGKCWRDGAEIVKKEVDQWFLKLTEYADRLIWPSDAQVDWPTSVKVGQTVWIGRSEGVLLKFAVENSDENVEVFTTALDTVYGVTFLVVAPEHPILKTTKKSEEVEKYIKAAQKKTEIERISLYKEKTGQFTGTYCINPFNGERVPVWVADYVIMTYGTGAVMGVPGHDERDHDFAQKYHLPIRGVIKPCADAKNASVESDGFWDYQEIKTKFSDCSQLYDSGDFSGMNSKEAKKKMEDFIEEKGFGQKKVQYHLRDWSISRQRYWGTPIPIIHCPKCGMVAVPEDQLPIELPYEVDFTPKGKPPLASNEEWLNTACPKCGGEAKRDDQTLDGFFDNSWYFFRYLDPNFDKGPFDTDLAKKLTPIDIYFGGAEHTLGHTLYARFFTKFFKDLGLVSYEEFANKRVQHGVVLGPDGNRMSKSKGNVVNPDDLVKEYGADTVRLYLAFMMPYIETTAPFSPGSIAGIYRFLRRVWDLFDRLKEGEMGEEDLHMMHKTIQKVTTDLEEIKFNTAIAALMEWINYLSPKAAITKKEYETLLLLLSPFAPHFTEELWHELGNADFIHLQAWPAVKGEYLKQKTVAIAIQINGKVRDVLHLSSESAKHQDEVEQIALASQKVKNHLQNKNPKKIIYIEGKILSLVV